MFKSIGDTIKSFGKKAIGYVRGLNGKKIASFLGGAASTYLGPFGALLQPFADKAGDYLNDLMDKYSESQNSRAQGGIRRRNEIAYNINKYRNKQGPISSPIIDGNRILGPGGSMYAKPTTAFD